MLILSWSVEPLVLIMFIVFTNPVVAEGLEVSLLLVESFVTGGA